MKFIANTTSLVEHLQKISGILVSKPTLPIIENFLFNIDKKTLTITSTDLETSMSTEMSVESDGKISVAVPSRLMLETLKSLPNQPVTFTIDDKTFQVQIKSEFGSYKLAGLAGSDFPKIPEVESESSFSIASDTLQNCIAKTLFATSNDELRMNLTGVFVELEKNGITFVATDANRLVKIKRSDVKPGVVHNFILPKKALNLLKTSLSGASVPVQVDYNRSNAFFSFGDTKLVCRFIDEKYPNYNAVIPQDNPNVLIMSRDDLYNTVKRISIFSNKSTHQIRLKLSGSEINISAEDNDLNNEANERIACEYNGEDLEIGFNSKLLLELLGSLDIDVIKMELSSPKSAGLILPNEMEKGEDMLMLIMPMMINN
ncbi:MAG: DNA polymerase III subunit beta [Flavobacteriales bacterium]|nr:DNA polymerase III subunit beta [Flavobacteriales bacterium]